MALGVRFISAEYGVLNYLRVSSLSNMVERRAETPGPPPVSTSLVGCDHAVDRIDDLFDVKPQALGHARPIVGIRLVEVRDLQLLDGLRNLLQAADDVVDQPLLRVFRHQAEQVSRLGLVVVFVAVIVAIHRSRDRPRTFTIGRVLRGAAEAVRLIVGRGAAIAVEAHGAVPVVGGKRALRLVDREGVVICSHAIAHRGRRSVGPAASCPERIPSQARLRSSNAACSTSSK